MTRSARTCVYFTIVLCSLLSCLVSPADAAETLHIGSKRFTESYILGEIVTQTAASTGTQVEHLRGLGNTAIVLAALQTHSIDLYPEYLGTIEQDILKHTVPASIDTIHRELALQGLGMGVPLGFNNTYALAMRHSDAQQRGIHTMQDLMHHPELKFGLSHEFLGRPDGWPGVSRHYGLRQKPIGLDHGIAYEALRSAQVDVIDIYSTDAKIAQFDLVILQDDLHYFPRYDAMLLYRLDVASRFPRAWQAIRQLAGHVTDTDMIALNAAVEIDNKTFTAVAREFLARKTDARHVSPATQAAIVPGAMKNFFDKLFDDSLWRLTREHLTLVVLSVVTASLIGIPLGVLAAYLPRLEQTVMAIVGVLQTIPSLALLAMLIPLLGRIGTLPALITLFLYALLPIVRNTCTGIAQVPPGLRMAALALGLNQRDRLLFIDLPLARPVILAGLKTAAVMSVGTATIAAFIGAGGYGERIAIGLALNDNATLLAGAIPAAVLALLMQAAFELIERHFRLPTNVLA